MAKMEKVERGIYRIENKDGSVSWMIDYLNPDKKRVRVKFSTLKQAREERAKRIALVAEGEYCAFVKKRKSYNTTFGQLLKLYEENYKNQPSYKTAKRFFVKKFRKHFKKDTLLSSIEYGHIKAYRNKLMQSVNQHDRPLEPSSINREMSCLRQMFNEAVEFGMIDRNPFNDAKSLHLKENNERNRFLTPDGARKLYKECAIHLQQIIEYVFTYQGQPVKDTKGALKTACKNAKIPYGRNEPNGITFHDLRHSYGSYLMQQRTDFRTTQELLGHKDPKMTQRYTHVIDDTKKQAVNSLNWDLHGKKSMSANVS